MLIQKSQRTLELFTDHYGPIPFHKPFKNNTGICSLGAHQLYFPQIVGYIAYWCVDDKMSMDYLSQSDIAMILTIETRRALKVLHG